MIDFTAFGLWVILVLITPGPTNTLLALGGTLDGPKALRLVAAELAGYLISIGILTFLILMIPSLQQALPLLRLVCGLFVIGLAIRNWRKPDLDGQARAASVNFLEVLVTTILNPKGLIFALQIFPSGGITSFAESLPYFGIFALICPTVGSLWTLLGCLIRAQLADNVPRLWLRRVGAAALACFGFLLVADAIA